MPVVWRVRECEPMLGGLEALPQRNLGQRAGTGDESQPVVPLNK